MTTNQQPIDVGNVPAHVFRTIAVMADPIDPDELVTNPTFRMAVEAAYTHGRASLNESYCGCPVGRVTTVHHTDECEARGRTPKAEATR